MLENIIMYLDNIKFLVAGLAHNARLTVQIFDGGFYAFICIKGDSEGS
jgi:hypothetical protein